MLEHIPGMAVLADDYDGFIIDLWGVLHDGLKPFPRAISCLAAMKQADKRVILLSNAPRRAASAQSRLDQLGFPRSGYDGLMTSGEEAWQHLSRRDDAFYRSLGTGCYVLAPPRDRDMIDGLDLRGVEHLEDASFILNLGPEFGETIADYDDLLDRASALGLAMICANPDHEVMHDGRREICAGALAAAYEARDGVVQYHGKPYVGVYHACFDLMPGVVPDRICAIGDSLRTDIAGAEAAGIASVFVTSGIHGAALGIEPGDRADRARVAALCHAAKLAPRAVLSDLHW